MYNKILVAMALDHDISANMLKFAQSVLNDGGKVIALHVLEEATGTAATTSTIREDAKIEGENRAVALFEKKLTGFPDVEPHIMHGHVSRTLIDYAEKNGIDCIVMGSHRPELVDYLMGSTAARVVRHAPCSVHVYRG